MNKSPNGRQRAYDYLRSQVLVDPATQGTFLNEQAIANEIGLSRTPVREAMRVLATEGLVELVPNRGTYVPRVTRQQARDVLELRRILECHAAEVVLTSQRTPIAAMGALLGKQRRLIGADAESSSIDFIALDREFHFELLKAGGNAEIIRTYDRLQIRQRIIGAEALSDPARRESVCTEHQAILDALEAGDLPAVHRVITEHIERTEEQLLGALTE